MEPIGTRRRMASRSTARMALVAAAIGACVLFGAGSTPDTSTTRSASFLGSQALAAEEEQKFWVIVGSFTDQEAAARMARDINAESPDLQAFVGWRMPGNPYHPVIVGDYVTRTEAVQVIERAKANAVIRATGNAPYLSAFADRR